MKDQRRKVLWMIWFVFLIMPGFHWFALQFVLRDPTFSPYFRLGSALPLQVGGAIIALASLVAWRALLSPTALKKAASGPEGRLKSWLVRHICLYVCVDTLSMAGLVIGILFRSSRPASAFFAAAACLTAIFIPNTGALDEANGEKKGAFSERRRPFDSKLE